MKIVGKFVIKSYLGPFVMTFFIAMFVFFMLFIFKYIDDFVGKGLDFSILFELFFYFSLTTIPMALPLAILLSSLMTFGNLGEHFELTALKSAGMSLRKIMQPLIFFIFFLSLLAFFFSNNILPYTNLKAGSLLYDIRESKPALIFKDGIFNKSIDGFSIRVASKGKDGKTLNNILIYDHREMRGNNIVLTAKEGRMEETPDKMFLVLTLRNGQSYKEVFSKTSDKKTRPLVRDKFTERVIRFDLSEFKLTRTKEELFKNNYQMLNMGQLTIMIDSLERQHANIDSLFLNQIQNNYYSRSTIYINKVDSLNTATYFNFDSLAYHQQLNLIDATGNLARSASVFIDSKTQIKQAKRKNLSRYKAEWHRKYTLSIACLVLFFIGAPLGAIIRKGGLGMPVVVSIVFFLIFHILSITGEKLAKEGSISTALGMWLATLILLPIGIFLTYKASKDSNLFNIDSYLESIKKLLPSKKQL